MPLKIVKGKHYFDLKCLFRKLLLFEEKERCRVLYIYTLQKFKCKQPFLEQNTGPNGFLYQESRVLYLKKIK